MAKGSEPRRPILRSERLYLHPLERDALEATVEWFADREFAEGFNTRAPESLVSTERWVEKSHREQGKTRWDFDVRLRDGARPISFAGLMDVDAGNGSAELLIGIGERSLRDQGYGTEAIGIVLDFAFGELRLHRVQLRVWASARSRSMNGWASSMRPGTARDISATGATTTSST